MSTFQDYLYFNIMEEEDTVSHREYSTFVKNEPPPLQRDLQEVLHFQIKKIDGHEWKLTGFVTTPTSNANLSLLLDNQQIWTFEFETLFINLGCKNRIHNLQI